jgi:Skp family chaperone for outer membrane proteins
MFRIWMFLAGLAVVIVTGASLAMAEPVIIKKPVDTEQTAGESTDDDMDHVVGEELC